MASITHAEPGLNPGPMSTAESLVPASMFAPPSRGCAEDAGPECFEDGETLNGEVGDHGVDFSSKVAH